MAYSRRVTLYDATQWHELFVASAGAAAALAGLVFVAVSINVERIIAVRGLPERALQAFLLLLSAVVVSIVGLVPEHHLAGRRDPCHGGVAGRRHRDHRPARLRHRGEPDVAGLAAGRGAAGKCVLPHRRCQPARRLGRGLAWVTLGLIGGMVQAVVNAWMLLVEIRR